MNCANHNEREASGACVFCGKLFCSDCLVDVNGKNYCKDCVGKAFTEAKETAKSSSSNININNVANATANNMAGGYGVSPKSKSVAAILAALGIVCIAGIHRFYVGKIWTGLIWFFTGGLFGIGTIIDLIQILSGTFRDGAGFVIRN